MNPFSQCIDIYEMPTICLDAVVLKTDNKQVNKMDTLDHDTYFLKK